MGTDNTTTATPSPQEQVMGVVMGITQGRSLVAAAELGLPDALAEGPPSVEAIAAKVQADADNVFRLMRALETIGVFKQVFPRVFENTPMSECMWKDVSGSQWAFLRIWAPGWGYWDGLGEMLETLRTGKTTLFDTWGYDIWGTTDDIPNSGRCSTRPCAQ